MSNNVALFADCYELTMAQAYLNEGMTGIATFSLFVRRMPHSRDFLVACGLDTVLDYLENLHFDEDDIAYLRSLKKFSDVFLSWLQNFRFSGTVYAVAEGTPVFGNEPILEIVAPLPEAQIVETFVMNQIHLQTLLCSKAQRVVTAASGRPVIDFGARRMHGTDAAIKGARAFYIGGVSATSNLLGGKIYKIPVTGTMAHSYIQSHEDEKEAFRAFARTYPETILLVDTYDTMEGLRKIVELKKELGSDFRIKGVRLDSGDLLSLSQEARKMLDESGLKNVEIFVSGGLDEYRVAQLVLSGAPIDGFGVGTKMGVSKDVPDLDIAYKLCEYSGRGCLKLSPGKIVLPGRKQVFRVSDGTEYLYDVVGKADEILTGKPLLNVVMKDGKRLAAGKIKLKSIREYAAMEIALLPAGIRNIRPSDSPYPVTVSPALAKYQKEVEEGLMTT